MRIARFVHPGSANAASGVAWGTVEGPPGAGPEALTVAAIDGHPFGPITFTGDRWALDDVRLLSPILPSKVVAIGKNYAEHAAEMGGEAPTTPLIFLKPSTSVIGDGDAIRLPASSSHVDFEGELAAVIGRPAKDVAPEDALSYVLGYCAANDVTARDQQRADGQFTRGQGLRLVLPDRPVDRDRPRPARSAAGHPGQRRGQAGRPHQLDGPRRRRPRSRSCRRS